MEKTKPVAMEGVRDHLNGGDVYVREDAGREIIHNPGYEPGYIDLEDLVVWLVKNRREMVRKAYLLGSSSESPRLHAEYEAELSKRLAGNTMGFVPLDEIGVKDAS